jgi:hypothetical protein
MTITMCFANNHLRKQLCISFSFAPLPRIAGAMLNFQFGDDLTIPQILQAWKALLNVPFALDILSLLCWAIWMVRNDVIFRHKNPSVEDCRRYLTMESLLLLHRTKLESPLC